MRPIGRYNQLLGTSTMMQIHRGLRDIVHAGKVHPAWLLLPTPIVLLAHLTHSELLPVIPMVIPIIGYFRKLYDYQLYWIYGLILPFSAYWGPAVTQAYLLDPQPDYVAFAESASLPIIAIHILACPLGRNARTAWFFAVWFTAGFAYPVLLIYLIIRKLSAQPQRRLEPSSAGAPEGRSR